MNSETTVGPRPPRVAGVLATQKTGPLPTWNSGEDPGVPFEELAEGRQWRLINVGLTNRVDIRYAPVAKFDSAGGDLLPDPFREPIASRFGKIAEEQLQPRF